MRRIGIVGYGKLGQYLCTAIQKDPELELAFVWNRNRARFDERIPKDLIIEELNESATRTCDLVVEVAHPVISKEWGAFFLAHSDYMIGSPTALADRVLEEQLLKQSHKHGLYIPRGALPGLEEVLALRANNKLSAASITMRKHPKSLKYSGPILESTTNRQVYYRGPLRELCGYAPNNVNTMAVLALSSGLGFDALQAELVADTSLEHHITEVSLFGPGPVDKRFSLELVRKSPAGIGAVTSSATFDSFLRSLRGAHQKGTGIHFC